jgi:sensor histidine kinase YesM
MRYMRHFIFWVAWWIYFAGSYFFTQQETGHLGSAGWISIILIKSLLLLFCHAFMVYVSAYLLLPRIINKRGWILSIGIFLVSLAITIAWGYFCYAELFPLLDKFFAISVILNHKIIFWNSISAGLISSIKIVIAALAIKLVKYWWQKQKETEKLEKEKIALELQLLKAQIHPDILFDSLENIYRFAKQNPPQASELIIKLSDVLSYVLYECDVPSIALEKELKMIKDYLALQKIKMGNQLEISLIVKGETKNKMIAPLLFLPIIENSLTHSIHNQLDKRWININITINSEDLVMKVVNGKSPDQKPQLTLEENGLQNIFQRLELIYPGKNELRLYEEPEVMMTYLKIKPDEIKSERLSAKTNSVHESV